MKTPVDPKEEIRTLKAQLNRAKKHIKSLIYEVEFAIASDAGFPGEAEHPIQTTRKRKATAAKKFLEECALEINNSEAED